METKRIDNHEIRGSEKIYVATKMLKLIKKFERAGFTRYTGKYMLDKHDNKLTAREAIYKRLVDRYFEWFDLVEVSDSTRLAILKYLQNIRAYLLNEIDRDKKHKSILSPI